MVTSHLEIHRKPYAILRRSHPGKPLFHQTALALKVVLIPLRRSHGLGVVHGDLNKHNFLISERGVVLIDFETAKLSGDTEGMGREVVGLEGQLLDDSGNGGTVVEV